MSAAEHQAAEPGVTPPPRHTPARRRVREMHCHTQASRTTATRPTVGSSRSGPCLIAQYAPPFPPGIPPAGAQRSALGAAAWTSVASGTRVAPGTASPLSRTPHGDRARSGKRLPTAPLGVGVHAHGLIAVAAQCLIALAAAIEPGAPRSISRLTNLGDGAPDLASLAWRGVIPARKAV